MSEVNIFLSICLSVCIFYINNKTQKVFIVLKLNIVHNYVNGEKDLYEKPITNHIRENKKKRTIKFFCQM